ncbi:MAG: PepSY-associated TM helix domain-containing protein [Pseudomonadota bacterium]
MANRERQIRIYDMHSWTGIALGIMLFVVCFTGSVALFYNEFRNWEDPATRVEQTDQTIPMQDIFTEWLDENVQGRDITFASLNAPGGRDRSYFSGFLNVRDEEGETEFLSQSWNPATGEPIENTREAGANRFLYNLHRDLSWPEALGGRTVGRALVGIVGIAFMLLVLTGIIAHTKITKELFSLRYLKSVRLKWQDTHKVFGLWTVPFSSMIAFTGAYLGVIAILAPLIAAITVQGDTEKLVQAIGIGPSEKAGIEAEMISVDKALATPHPETGIMPTGVTMENFGDLNAAYTMQYPVDDRLLFFDQYKISAVDGRELPLSETLSPNEPLPRILGALTPLHYGTYGGIVLKIGYFLMGIALCVMAALGNMMWIERRLHGGEGNKSEKFYRALSALSTGVCAGMPAASVVILHFDKFYWGAEATRYSNVVSIFFIVWLATLIFAWFRGNDYRAARELLAATGLGMMALPISNGLMTGDFLWSAFGTGASGSAWFDLTFLIFGALICAGAMKIPANRPIDKRRAKKARKASEEPAVDPGLQPAE